MNAHTKIEAGIHRLAADAYHADPAPEPSLSSTLARTLMNQSPLHAWTACPRLNPDFIPEDKKTFDIGRAAHRELLGAGGDWTVIPEGYLSSNGAASTKEAKQFIADAREAGLTPIKATEAAAVQQMAAACRARLDSMGIKLDPARSEIAALAKIDGVWTRCMVDNAPEKGPLIDFKTTVDASPEAIRRSVQGYGYDVQEAHYRAVWEAATGEKRKFLFVFQEKTAPYETQVVQLYADDDAPGDWMAPAREKAKAARRLWGECLAADCWPGYPPRILSIDAPAWHAGRWEERKMAMADAPSPAAVRAAFAAQAPI